MKILRREDYDDLDFQRRLEYINRAIIEFGVRSKAYKEIGIAKSTVESMMKSNGYAFNKEINQFIQSNSIASMELHSGNIEEAEQHSGCIAHTEEHSRYIETAEQDSDCIALVEQRSNSIVDMEQQAIIMKELFEDWHILKNIINNYKSNADVIDVDTSVKLEDLPESISKSINLRLNEKIWLEFNKHIKKRHKAISQKNMVEIALLQFIKDNK